MRTLLLPLLLLLGSCATSSVDLGQRLTERWGASGLEIDARGGSAIVKTACSQGIARNGFVFDIEGTAAATVRMVDFHQTVNVVVTVRSVRDDAIEVALVDPRGPTTTRKTLLRGQPGNFAAYACLAG